MWVNAADVGSLWRPITADETTLVTTLISVAEDLLAAQWPIGDWLARGVVKIDTIKWCVAEMVKSAMEDDADQVKTEQVTAGPFQRSLTYDAARSRMSIPRSAYLLLSKLAVEQGSTQKVGQAWMV